MPRFQIMGVLNITADSFSDGGQYLACDAALQHARNMVADGATLIDVGGESTRPGAQPQKLEDELQRVIPVITAIAAELDVKISIDTSKPEVMRQAIAAGAHMINDVCALQADGAIEAVREMNVPVCLMHMQGTPGMMQENPTYQNVVEDVKNFLQQRIDVCIKAGIKKDQLMIDPGFCFGKTLAHNLELFKHLDAFLSFDLPVLIGVSRKSMIGTILDKPVNERLYGGLGLAVLAVAKGASIIRTHDVRETYEALLCVDAVLNDYE